MNIILILCALIICLFGGYAEPTLPRREHPGVPSETDGLRRLLDRYPHRPDNRKRRLP
jgi:hypothetical protein